MDGLSRGHNRATTAASWKLQERHHQRNSTARMHASTFLLWASAARRHSPLGPIPVVRIHANSAAEPALVPEHSWAPGRTTPTRHTIFDWASQRRTKVNRSILPAGCHHRCRWCLLIDCSPVAIIMSTDEVCTPSWTFVVCLIFLFMTCALFCCWYTHSHPFIPSHVNRLSLNFSPQPIGQNVSLIESSLHEGTF